MRKIILAATALLLAVAFGIQAQDQVRLNPDHPDVYVVQEGDTLWDISGRFLAEPWQWPEIWQVNPQVENPHLIYPGDRLRLVYVEGQPQLHLERGPRGYKLSPAAGTNSLHPQVRREPLADAIPAIPLDAINAFLSRTRIVAPDAFKGAPYVISGADQRILMGAGERIYARGDFREPLASYGIYRPGPVYADPVTGEILGRQALDVGSADLFQLDPDHRENFAVATMQVTRTAREIRLEDRLLPVEERSIAALFQPGAPAVPVDGYILGVDEGVTQIGKYDVVVVNRGEREGLQPGHVLSIYKQGATVRDRIERDTVKLPDEYAGVMMVFRTFEKMSLALVLEADRPLEVMDLVRNP
ncbi:LysM peptidoglycan-binding domain-containing protein [Microbulbifer thermotolerans]|uniref:LysM peptidoglycan-binding domain-containing protein n=1 Tax=Microbulbifer thermotolerans TaxID=252514 RepID=A0A143HI65_MICTH|nr:LysM domain-containing protein [Microbulbifer thermotolerans]AMX01196.1 peptidoglycan-binding protein [Microbulbifer thermotolerans]MCX2778489.1 LysM peptidoglycan-binding domain-containing protein [Microbulbifer thermotolerans]MCX2782975.1 LysM peptidoglycan-binding domain-containing protein [Microbulbifer thermotolerans]MCX2801677.1 LysM peptidoglycan-binding domain-containing protein [Microbulbifer thermotolerans]MCX2804002.1 LysM peptidoglycan-binding domain-containing protein [Microbul